MGHLYKNVNKIAPPFRSDFTERSDVLSKKKVPLFYTKIYSIVIGPHYDLFFSLQSVGQVLSVIVHSVFVKGVNIF